jgi:hypothetical protein
MMFEDEIIEIIEIGEMELMDIEVDGDHLFLANDILTHNSSIEVMGEFDQSHTAGGISKINTADNAIALYAPPSHKERGDFEFIMLKTRSSSGVGHRIKLSYDPTCMRISDPGLTVGDVDRPSTYADLRREINEGKDTAAAPEKTDVLAKLSGMMAKKRQ